MLKFFERFKQDHPPVDLASITSHLALDLTADSEDDTVLPFMAPPKGAEPYHGFKVLTNVTHEGFTLGAITDFVKPLPQYRICTKAQQQYNPHKSV